MNLNVILGIMACIFSASVVIGLVLDDLTYWLIMDGITIIFLPIIGIRLIMISKKST